MTYTEQVSAPIAEDDAKPRLLTISTSQHHDDSLLIATRYASHIGYF